MRRMNFRRHWAFSRPPAAAAVLPSVRASSKATTPATNSGSQSGSTVVVPVPTGTQNGDLMIAIVNATGAIITPPAGWTEIVSQSDTRGYSRVASSEPASYTWTIGEADYSRNGVMISVKDANSTLGDIQSAFYQLNGKNFPVPDLSVSVAGSLLVAFATSGQVTITEDFTADSPLSMQVEHACNGSVSYSIASAMALATEAGLSVGTLTGRNFVNNSSDELLKVVGGIIIKPL